MITTLKKIGILKIAALVVLVLCSGCSRHRKVEIEGIPGVSFYLTTEYDAFERTEGLYYEIIDSDGNVIEGRTFILSMIGYRENDLKLYEAVAVDSILCLKHSGYFFMAYDLKSGEEIHGLNFDSLLVAH